MDAQVLQAANGLLAGDATTLGTLSSSILGDLQSYAAKTIARKIKGLAHNPNKGKKGKSRRRPSVTVKRDGVVGRRVYARKKKRKIKRPSLAKRIRALEGGKPALSRHKFALTSPFKLSTFENEKRVFLIPMLDRQRMENSMDNIKYANLAGTGVNFAAPGATPLVLLQNLYMELLLKNAMTSNMQVKYKFVSPTDDSEESYLDHLNEDYQSRGIGNVAKAPALTPNTLRANIPERLVYNIDQLYFPIGSTNATRKKYRDLTKMKSVTLGPGDSIKMVYTRKRHRYRPEDHDQDPDSYKKNEVYLLISLVGDLAHGNADGTDFTDVVGFGATSGDSMRRIVWDVVYDDGLGKQDHEENNDGDYSNFTSPQHVDNHQSAVEKDLE